ncbi:hypothetical protein EYF80_002605 [Liparis tanakae]|uniref:Uncharacterized protein n=1 Tax=Liparis tanakae TaxID=230148 RepID=A0A4Z2JC56_9TELE|nr:hypothetical protein EYF80_002605 [Liparis tanakae]
MDLKATDDEDGGSRAGFRHSSVVRRSQALDVELRSCSLKERRSFSFAEFLLEVIANPPLGHNNTILFGPQQTGCVTVSDRKAPASRDREGETLQLPEVTVSLHQQAVTRGTSQVG